jgi:hypothetical protein
MIRRQPAPIYADVMALRGQRHRNYTLALPQRVTLAWKLAQGTGGQPDPRASRPADHRLRTGAGTDSCPDEPARLGAD